MLGLLGKKAGMASVFNIERKNLPCTVIEVGPCVVAQIKTLEKGGYEVVRLSLQEKREKHTIQPETGYFKKTDVAPQRHLVEFRNFETRYKLGDVIAIDFPEDVGFVDVVDTSKDRGFQDMVRRHGSGSVGQTTHGQHNRACKPGSTGACSHPVKASKGMRVGGRMGNERITIQNL